MKSKDKVLKTHPTAFASKEDKGYRIKRITSGEQGLCLSDFQPRESWAWADAYRNSRLKSR